MEIKELVDLLLEKNKRSPQNNVEAEIPVSENLTLIAGTWNGQIESIVVYGHPENIYDEFNSHPYHYFALKFGSPLSVSKADFKKRGAIFHEGNTSERETGFPITLDNLFFPYHPCSPKEENSVLFMTGNVFLEHDKRYAIHQANLGVSEESVQKYLKEQNTDKKIVVHGGQVKSFTENDRFFIDQAKKILIYGVSKKGAHFGTYMEPQADSWWMKFTMRTSSRVKVETDPDYEPLKLWMEKKQLVIPDKGFSIAYKTPSGEELKRINVV